MLAKMYKKVVPLSKKEDLKVSLLKDYKHAKDVISTILTYDEVSKACKFYPIYFGKDANGIVPMAILGIDNENLFLDSKNQWQKDVYIPSVFRVYPLGMAKSGQKDGEESGKYTVVYDGSYIGINKKDGKEFVAKGKLTEFGQNTVDFLQNLQGNLNKTQEALKILEEYKILKFADIDISVGEKKYKISRVGTIDEKVLDGLSDDKIVKLVKQGVYRIIDLCLLSGSNLNPLVDRLQK